MIRIRDLAISAVLTLAVMLPLAACSTDATVVDKNIGQDADNFKILRRVVFINTRDNSYLLEVVGYCNINDQTTQIETICKVPGGYVKHFMGLSGQDVTYVAEQVAAADVSAEFYHFTVKPTTLLPLNGELR